MTKTEYAKHRGVSQAAISKMIRDDRILITADGLVDAEISDVLLDSFSESPLRHTKSGDDQDFRDGLLEQLKSSEVGTYAEQRALLTMYKAKMAKLDLDHANDKLTDTAKVREVAFNTARIVRDSLLNIPDRIAPIVAAESDVHKVRTLLDKELRRSLEELSNEFTNTNNIL